MARKLEKNIQLTTTTFDKDITDLATIINKMLLRHQQELEEKRQAEIRLNQAITNISHDLRTPLSAALGYLQMLENYDLDTDTQARYLQIVRNGLEALSSNINVLFEFTRALEGRDALDIQPVNICDILRDTLSASYEELIKKGFTVEADISDTPIVCLYDQNAIRRVLENLIKNACIHGQKFMRVIVKNDGTIEIANRAEGLDTLDTVQIFERFYTTDTARTFKRTGLGLAIAKELISRMNGKIVALVEDDMLIVRISPSEPV